MVDTADDRVWRLLMHVCVHDEASGDEARALVDGVDWDSIIVLALAHRIMPRLSDFLIRSSVMGLVPSDVQRVLVHTLNDNRFNNAACVVEAEKVEKAFAGRGVRLAFTKGIVQQSSLYGGAGGRSFEDIDTMVHPDDREAAAAAVLELGYDANKTYDFETDRLINLPRREQAMFRMYPDHLPHFYRAVSDYTRPYYAVDVCFNITWFGSSWQIPMDDVLARTRLVRVATWGREVELPALLPEYDFIFTVMHLFRENWFERTVVKKHARLSQFADVVRQWRLLDGQARADLAALIDRHGIAPPVAWVCHHLDAMFGSSVVADLGLGSYADEDWLRSMSAIDGSYLSWSGDMRERLMTRHTTTFAAAAEPPFAAAARAAGT